MFFSSSSQVSFVARREEAADNNQESTSSDEQQLYSGGCILFKPPFDSFFLRDLASISTSSDAPSVEDFLAALLGPSKQSRVPIKEVSIRLSTSRLTLFLLEALSRVECEWNGGVIEDMLGYLDDELLKLFVRRRLMLSKEVDISLDQLEAVGQLAKKLAPFEFSLFYDMHFGEINFDPENLESIHHSRDVPIYPFNSLSALTIPVDSILQLHLLFYSRSLPSLRCLAIIGTCYLSQTRRHDVKLLRRSITESVFPFSLLGEKFADTAFIAVAMVLLYLLWWKKL